MRTRMWSTLGSGAAAASLVVLGCGVGTTPTAINSAPATGPIPVIVVLDEPDPALAEFDVVADEPTEKSIAVNLQIPINANVEIAGGTFEFAPGDFSFEPAGASKAMAAAELSPFNFEVTGYVFSKTIGGTCGHGDEYGPYEVAVDETGTILSVSPPAIALYATTVELIKTNDVALCLRVESPVGGTVRIHALHYELTLASAEDDM